MEKENLESHKRVLGILFIIAGLLTFVIILFVSSIVAAGLTIAMNEADPDDATIIQIVASALQYLPVVIIVLFAIPELIAGVGLLTKKSWAMIFALIMGCVNLLSFPFGTALGIYTIWVYTQNQKLEKPKVL